jgi:hypothetical protein
MRPPASILEELELRDLAALGRRVAGDHKLTLEQICGPSRVREIVLARHAYWQAMRRELGAVTIARIFGVDHGTVISGTAACQARESFAMVDAAPICAVLLDDVHGYRFEWWRSESKPKYRVADPKGKESWFTAYHEARAAFYALAGAPNFASHASSAPSPPAADDGAGPSPWHPMQEGLAP